VSGVEKCLHGGPETGAHDRIHSGQSVLVFQMDGQHRPFLRALGAKDQDGQFGSGGVNAPQKHVWRANIILATADGCGTAEIMRRSGKSKPVVWRWQARFMTEGVEGLTRDKTRKPGKPPLPTACA
jgi:hypothetical protein